MEDYIIGIIHFREKFLKEGRKQEKHPQTAIFARPRGFCYYYAFFDICQCATV